MSISKKQILSAVKGSGTHAADILSIKRCWFYHSFEASPRSASRRFMMDINHTFKSTSTELLNEQSSENYISVHIYSPFYSKTKINTQKKYHKSSLYNLVNILYFNFFNHLLIFTENLFLVHFFKLITVN